LENFDDLIPVYARAKKLYLPDNYFFCFRCYGINLRNRTCLCGTRWKYWENEVGRILTSVARDWIQPQYHHDDLKSIKSGSSLDYDYVGKNIDLHSLSRLPKYGVEVNELYHFRSEKKGKKAFVMSIDTFRKIIFFWRMRIPLFFINIHECVSLDNIKMKTMDDTEIVEIARSLSNFLQKVDVYYSKSKFSIKDDYYIENFAKLPTLNIWLDPKSKIGYDDELVKRCEDLIEYANKNKLSDYFKKLWDEEKFASVIFHN
jgi:hypothetical protein